LHSKALVEQRPVSIGWQTVLMFVPYVWFYAFYRIEKLRRGIVICFISHGIGILTLTILPPVYGVSLTFVFTFAITIYFIRKWSREWNDKLSTTGSEKKESLEYVRGEDSSNELLKKRYAMGEISKEEFEKKKKDLENS